MPRPHGLRFGNGLPRPHGLRFGSCELGKLDDSQEVAFAVLEPCRADGPVVGNAVDGLEVRQVVFFEDQSPGFQVRHGGFNIVRLPARLGDLPG